MPRVPARTLLALLASTGWMSCAVVEPPGPAGTAARAKAAPDCDTEDPATWFGTTWTTNNNVHVVAGDLDGDGYDDVAGAVGGTYNVVSLSYGPSSTWGYSYDEYFYPYEALPYASELATARSPAGDVNGDGYDDLAVGWGNGSVIGGGVSVYFGSAGGIDSATADYAFSSAYLAHPMALDRGGDVNGDGYDDVLACLACNHLGENQLNVYFGSASGIASSPDIRLDKPDAANDYYFGGLLYKGAGDLNGDGYGDVVAGGSYDAAFYGIAWVWYGSPSGPAPAPDLQLTGSAYNSGFGYANTNTAAGDFDGDGYGDLAFGEYNPSSASGGNVRIHYGGPTGIGATADQILVQDTSRYTYPGTFGLQLGVYDLNRDGADDLLVTDNGTIGTTGEAVLALYLGDEGGLQTTPVARFSRLGGGNGGMPITLTSTVEGEGTVTLVDAAYGYTTVNVATCVEPVDPDADGDGSPASADCDDADPSIFPGAREECDGVDTNCDGFLDPADCVVDSDGDGWLETVDCDDHDATRYPGAPEVCDFTDNDCDGRVDEAVTQLLFEDADGDGAGSSIRRVSACEGVAGYSSRAGDCADEDPLVGPGFPELCDGLDNDCDGTTDELGRGASCASGSQGTGADADGDGWLGRADCDDSNPDAHPGAGEACDGVDTDCDGFLDDGTNAIVFADADGDGYGDRFAMTMACELAAGFSTQAGDCDDDNAGVHPGAPDTCDEVDNDCDGEVDERAAETCAG